MRYSSKQKLYTVAEIARMLKLSSLTVYKYIKDKKLEAVDFGGHYRITAFALQSFLDRHSTNLRTKETL